MTLDIGAMRVQRANQPHTWSFCARTLPRGGSCRIVDHCSRGPEHGRDWLVLRDRPLIR
jgi:hypothetical protein